MYVTTRIYIFFFFILWSHCLQRWIQLFCNTIYVCIYNIRESHFLCKPHFSSFSLYIIYSIMFNVNNVASFMKPSAWELTIEYMNERKTQVNGLFWFCFVLFMRFCFLFLLLHYLTATLTYNNLIWMGVDLTNSSLREINLVLAYWCSISNMKLNTVLNMDLCNFSFYSCAILMYFIVLFVCLFFSENPVY